MVIDFHIHAFNPKIAERAIQTLEKCSGIQPLTRGLIEQTVQRMDEWGIDRSVMLPIATKPSQQVIINDWAAQQDGGRIISFGSVHPDADDAIDELWRIKELGLHGVKLHPDYQGFKIDDDKNQIKGVILNRITKSFYERLKPLIEEETGLTCLGFFPEDKELNISSRHLGLMQPEEIKDLNILIDKAALIAKESSL